MTTLLEARGLTKRYGSLRALDDVSFEIEEGVTGLLGANGAGKSTSLKLFLGLIDPDGGSALFLDQDVRRVPATRERLGYAPEHGCLPEHVPAAEFLAHIAEVSGLPRSAARVRATDVLRHVGLFEERYRPIGTYSTGMKQRVKLAQALVHDPVLAILDEPTAGLDPIGRQEMLDLIRRTGHDFGISIVLSSHLMGDVERTCDRVIVLEAGKLLRQGPVASFVEDTATVGIELVEGAEALGAALELAGLAATREGNRLVVGIDGAADYDTIRDAIVESGAVLYRMAPVQHDLAEIFESSDRPDVGQEADGSAAGSGA